MNPPPPPRVVFDCPVYAQLLLNPLGPAGRCFDLAQQDVFQLVISDDVVREIRELPDKLLPRFRITEQRVDRLITVLNKTAVYVRNVPPVFVHPVDPDDSAYVNLAVAAGVQFLVTRDKHLLRLPDSSHPAWDDFTSRFPSLTIIDPVAFLRSLPERFSDHS